MGTNKKYGKEVIVEDGHPASFRNANGSMKNIYANDGSLTDEGKKVMTAREALKYKNNKNITVMAKDQYGGQTIIINQQQSKSNGIGTAGFVFALLALFFGWIPVLGWIMWFLGLLFSFIGIFKSPRGLSIVGLIISLLGIILLLVVFTAISQVF